MIHNKLKCDSCILNDADLVVIDKSLIGEEKQTYLCIYCFKTEPWFIY